MGLLLLLLQLQLRTTETDYYLIIPQKRHRRNEEREKREKEKVRKEAGPIMRTGFDSLVSGRGTSQGSRPREGQPGGGRKEKEKEGKMQKWGTA